MPNNALINESSLYLLQHAHNPVNWLPWGEEALLKAREENKPILLSIGYSACHWCHVMAHESFEDNETAAMMNELFVNIKVDKEERPDLDRIYQLAHQLLTQRSGGWPLTMFLAPADQTPFFGGTYFPKDSRHGLPPFKNILQMVSDFFHNKPDQLKQQNAELLQYLSQDKLNYEENNEAINQVPLDECITQLKNEFDKVNGGFGGSPKFPYPTSMDFLLNQWNSTELTNAEADESVQGIVEKTMSAMAKGGIYDHLGGGFFRYSVDAEWMIPHFEKMLYDNGQLLSLYANAYGATGDQQYKKVAQETAAWTMHEMQSREGGYYSTLDADSENIEGKHYYWNNKEVRLLLDDDEFLIFSQYYGLDSTPNFEGQWHLYVDKDLEVIAHATGVLLERAESLLNSAKDKLFNYRENRIKPGRDEKIITSWNGLMIKGMAVAGKQLECSEFLDSAERSIDFIRKNMWIDGRLAANYKNNITQPIAYLDDYVFLIDGILSYLEARWNTEYLKFAIELMDVVLDHYSVETGGFYFTANDHEPLLYRPVPFMDEATPAGNAIAAQVLIKLGHILGETRYLDAAESTIRASWKELERVPHAHCAMLTVVNLYLTSPEVLIVRGDESELSPWAAHLSNRFGHNKISLLIPSDAADLPGSIRQYKAPEAGALAYVCKAGNCLPPVTNITQFESL